MTDTVSIDFLNPAFIGDDFIEGAKVAYPQTVREAFARAREARHQPPSPLEVTITYLSDNGAGPDLAISEIGKRFTDITAILQTLNHRTTAPEVKYYDIPRQNPIAGALDLAQLGRDTVRGVGNIIFVNCAPRLKESGQHKNNQGEQVYAGVLPNGTIVAGVGLYSFGFCRDLLDQGDLELFKVHVQTSGSQFRSRDFFPWFASVLGFNLQERAEEWAAAGSVEERRALLTSCDFIDTDRPVDPASVPDLRAVPMAVRIDIHGNIKLNQTIDDVPADLRDEPVWVVIGNRAIKTKLCEAMFAVGCGDDAIAPGSTGDWGDVRGDTPRLLQIARINADFAEALNVTHDTLKLGLPIHVIKASDLERAMEIVGSNGLTEAHFAGCLVEAGLVNGFDNRPLQQRIAHAERHNGRGFWPPLDASFA